MFLTLKKTYLGFKTNITHLWEILQTRKRLKTKTVMVL